MGIVSIVACDIRSYNIMGNFLLRVGRYNGVDYALSILK